MNKILNFKSEIFILLIFFLIWRLILFIILLYSINFVPLGYKDRFLGGGSIYYHISPELFSWANFDGEHYLSIAIFGYKSLEQAFFPIYPLLISIFAKPLSSDLLSSLINSTIVGLLISNIAFFLALVVLYKLILLDYSKKIALLTISILLCFPTSFYFGSLYNESLFLLLSLFAFYNARKKRWLIAAIFGAIASATRVFGILLFPIFFYEAYQQKEKLNKFFWIFIIPFGLGFYMLYQYQTVGDLFAFYHIQKLVGEQHQEGLILLPQVYFRYIKMILTVAPQNSIYQTILFEFIIGIIFFLLPIIGFLKKVRISYLLYSISAFLLPTLTGSFSSLPRYVLVLFPNFLILALIISKINLILRLVLVILFVAILILEATLFLRGYWVA